jgi:TatD DNase family protein
MDKFFCDTHAHLSDEAFDEDRVQVARNALDNGLDFIIDVGTNLRTWEVSRELSMAVDNVYTAVGWHPHDAEQAEPAGLLEQFKEWSTEKTVAVGEIGLDYHYDFSPRIQQRKIFGAQLEMAAELNLPSVIHIREAWNDAFDILSSVPLDNMGVVHCFSGNYEQARTLLDFGLYLSFTGVIAFPKSSDLRDIIRKLPVERIFFETDSPYLAPPPKRGKRNVPENVKHIVEVAATELGMTINDLASMTTETSREFFNIPMK